MLRISWERWSLWDFQTQVTFAFVPESYYGSLSLNYIFLSKKYSLAKIEGTVGLKRFCLTCWYRMKKRLHSGWLAQNPMWIVVFVLKACDHYLLAFCADLLLVSPLKPTLIFFFSCRYHTVSGSFERITPYLPVSSLTMCETCSNPLCIE